MAVYTVLDANAISGILQAYAVGELQGFEAISSGIENTNYFVWSKSCKNTIDDWVLTIFENVSKESLPFFNNLTCHLSKKGFAVPAPQPLKDGQFVFSIDSTLANQLQPGQYKQGVLVPKFHGKSVDLPSLEQCQMIAAYTANMHLALSDFDGVQAMPHSLKWCEHLVRALTPKLSHADVQLLGVALARYRSYQTLIHQCSQGAVHGDLFRDNVLFQNGEISGVIDFYNAGQTAFLFDLAVIANDWVVNFEGLPDMFSSDEQPEKERALIDIYDEEKLNALVQAYASIKPFTQAEQEAWPRLLELAAFRFWLSRLKTKYLQSYQQDSKAGEVIKSPEAMKAILRAAMAR